MTSVKFTFRTGTRYSQVVKEHTVFGYIEWHIRHLETLGRTTTACHTRSLLRRLREYRCGEDFSFNGFTPRFIEAFEAHLKRRGLQRNTTSFYLRRLRAIYRQAVEEGMSQQTNPFKHVYTGVDKTAKRAVTQGEIKRIYAVDLSSCPRWKIARDLFLFSFYTCGMSFIDMAFLRKAELRNGFLTYRRHKTGQKICVKWLPEMQEITNRYAEITSATPYLLPIIVRNDIPEWRQYRNAMMRLNRHLKMIGRRAGIDAPLSMYVARHSWATIARDMNIPLSVISKGLGHDNDANTAIYLASIKTSEVERANRKILNALRK